MMADKLLTYVARPGPESDDDGSSISLTSTVSEVDDGDSMYNVEKILSEFAEEDGKMCYLIEWENYPLEASTWEPEENLTPQILREWFDEKMRIERGNSKPFNLDAWQLRVEKFKAKKRDRKIKRKEKRTRLGIRASKSLDDASNERSSKEAARMLDSDSSEEASEADEEFEDGITGDQINPSRLSSSRTPKFADQSRYNEDDDIGNLSADSLVGELRQKEAKRKSKGGASSQKRRGREPIVSGKSKNQTHSRENQIEKATSPPLIRGKDQNTTSETRTEGLSETGYVGTANRGSRSLGIPLNTVRKEQKSVSTSRTEGLSETDYVESAQSASRSEIISESTRGKNAGRIRSGRRGFGGQLRGGDRHNSKPTFTKEPLVQPKRRSLVNTVIEMPKNNGELFKTMATKRKVELAGRAAADRAIDPSTLTLIDPSEARKGRSLQKRRPSIRVNEPESTETLLKTNKPRVRFAETDDDSNLVVDDTADIQENMASSAIDNIPAEFHAMNHSQSPPIQRNDEFHSVTLNAMFGNDAVELNFSVVFGDKSWVDELAATAAIDFNLVCSSDDLRLTPVIGKFLVAGNVSTNNDGNKVVDHVCENLRPNLCAAFAHRSFTVVLFPPSEDWNFLLEKPLRDVDTTLQFYVFQPSAELHNLRWPSVTTPTTDSLDLSKDYLNTMVASLLRLDYNLLVPGKSSDTGAMPSFFICFPVKAAATATFLENWLHACNSDTEIWTSHKQGSWRLFTDQEPSRPCAVLIHETLVPKMYKIPGLSKLLLGEKGARFTFWCVSDCSFAAPIYSKGEIASTAFPASTTISRLLPQGGAVLLTPSFFFSEPLQTYHYLLWITEKAEKSVPGTWKIVTCHDVRGTLLDLANSAAQRRRKLFEDFPSDVPDHVKNEKAVRLGLDLKDCEARYMCHNLLDSIMSKNQKMWLNEDDPNAFDFPIVCADQSIGLTDEATLIEWFSGWTIARMNLFRKFIVIGTRSSPSRTATTPQENTEVSISKEAFFENEPRPDEIKVVEASSRNFSTSHIPEALPRNSKKKTEISASFSHLGHQYDMVPPLEQSLDNVKGPALLMPVDQIPKGATGSLHLPNLPGWVTVGKLEQIFDIYGPIVFCRVIPNPRPLQTSNGFVNFVFTTSACNARYKLFDKDIFETDESQKINFAIPRNYIGTNGSLSSYVFDQKLQQNTQTQKSHRQRPSLLTEELPLDATSSLWLGAVPYEMTDAQLEDEFRRFGPVREARVGPPFAPRPTGYINFVHTASAVNARLFMRGNKFSIDGVNGARVNFAKPVHSLKSPPGSPMGFAETWLMSTGQDYSTLPTNTKEASEEASKQIQEKEQESAESRNTKLLEWRIVSGNDEATARIYLSKNNWNSLKAFRAYVADEQTTMLNAEEILHNDAGHLDWAVLEDFVTTGARTVSLTSSDDIKRARQILHSWFAAESSSKSIPRTDPSVTKVTPQNDAMDEDTPPAEAPADSVNKNQDLERCAALGFKIKESTLDWYKKKQKSGGGWSHIYVCDAERGAKLLQVKSVKVDDIATSG